VSSEPTTYEPQGPFDFRIECDKRTDRVLFEVIGRSGFVITLLLTTQRARELAADIRDVCS
jgi:hypothetical protein